MEFNIGDKVIALMDHVSMYGNIYEGKTYTVRNVMRCSCGIVNIDVGVGYSTNGRTMCSVCNTYYEFGPWWIKGSRFTKADKGKSKSIDVTAFMDIFSKQPEKIK